MTLVQLFFGFLLCKGVANKRNTLFVTSLEKCSFQVHLINSKNVKRKVQSIKYADAVADILDWVENPEDEEDFELETNKIPDEIDNDE